jgi:hypothetical protein
MIPFDVSLFEHKWDTYNGIGVWKLNLYARVKMYSKKRPRMPNVSNKNSDGQNELMSIFG